MTISIEKTESGFLVSFPFALKDSFRAAMPNAKWDLQQKLWRVGPRGGKRLEQWRESIASAVEQIEQLDAELMGEETLAKVTAEAAQAVASLAALRKREENLLALEALIAGQKDLIAKTCALVDEKTKQCADAHKRILEQMGEIVDMEAISDAKRRTARGARIRRAALACQSELQPPRPRCRAPASGRLNAAASQNRADPARRLSRGCFSYGQRGIDARARFGKHRCPERGSGARHLSRHC